MSVMHFCYIYAYTNSDSTTAFVGKSNFNYICAFWRLSNYTKV